MPPKATESGRPGGPVVLAFSAAFARLRAGGEPSHSRGRGFDSPRLHLFPRARASRVSALLEPSHLQAQNGCRARADAGRAGQVVLPPRLGPGPALPGPRSLRAPVSLEEPQLLSPPEDPPHAGVPRLHGSLHWRD